MGLLDSLQGVFGFYADSHVPGIMQNLLIQLVIPMTIGLSIIFLKARYKISEYIGAVIILAGIVIDISPSFTNSANFHVNMFWVIVFLASVIPFACSTVYKEYTFKVFKMDVFYLMAWDSLFQCFWYAVFSPTDAIPGIGNAPPHTGALQSLGDIYSYLWYGVKCFGGVPTLPGDQCSEAWWLLLESAIFGVMINLCILYLLKQDNATFMFVALTMAVPCVNICFTLPLIMGDYAMPLNIIDIIALIVIIGGLLIYRFWAPLWSNIKRRLFYQVNVMNDFSKSKL